MPRKQKWDQKKKQWQRWSTAYVDWAKLNEPHQNWDAIKVYTKLRKTAVVDICKSIWSHTCHRHRKLSRNLFGSVSNNLYAINETTGAATLIGPLGIINFLDTLAGSSGNLFGSVSNNLYAINETTGAATLIGPLGIINFLDTLAGLGPAEVPEPSTLAIFGFALVGLGALRRRNSSGAAL